VQLCEYAGGDRYRARIEVIAERLPATS